MLLHCVTSTTRVLDGFQRKRREKCTTLHNGLFSFDDFNFSLDIIFIIGLLKVLCPFNHVVQFEELRF